jgi:hypothetical protein
VGFFVVDMDLTVRQHIAALEARMNALASELMDEKDRAKRNAVESEMRAVQMALAHYRAALDLENTLRGNA